ARMDRVLGQFQTARSQAGEMLNRLDGIESRLADGKLAAQNEKSNAEDLDMVRAISEFQNKQTGYEAALQSYASIQKMSLFQYIS
ncbi:flagellin, partial [Aquabacterium sp.]|uniref:flagellin n=1 Tax=Aquabacterium sp. TaxID=1872578 RepID=UPI0027BB00FD